MAKVKNQTLITILCSTFVIVLLLILTTDFLKIENIQNSYVAPLEKKVTNITASSNKYYGLSKNARTSLKNSYVSSCKFKDVCTITCEYATLQNVILAVNSLISKGNICEDKSFGLELIRTTFPSDSIALGWLNNITLSINNLKIESTDLNNIKNFAFSGKPFKLIKNSLVSVALTDTNILHLRKSMFVGSSIKVLQIDFYSKNQGITIEKDALEGIASSIQSISFTSCINNVQALNNVTKKGALLPELSTLSLSNNLIRRLEANVFIKTPNIEQLYLEFCQLHEIKVGAFKGLSKVKQLHINNNNIDSFSKGVFDGLDSLVSLYMQNNPWTCSCGMQWLKDYLSSLPIIEYRKCKIGSEWKSIDAVEFCPHNTTTTNTTIPPFPTSTQPSVTTSLTTKPSTSMPTTVHADTNNFIFEKIKCRNLLAHPFGNLNNEEEEIYFESVFKRRNINFTVSKFSASNLITYSLDLMGPIRSEDYLLWTNVADRSDYGCVYNIVGHIVMNLGFKSTYTICLASNDTVDIYSIIADDCTAISTLPEWKYRAWLFNNQKALILSSVILTFLISLVLASGGIYYIVKYNPELLRGNKRVLIVKNRSFSPNVLVMPHKNDTNRNASLCSDYAGYLTPKLKRWNKGKVFDVGYHELEIISDKSVGDYPSDEKLPIKNVYVTNGENNVYEPPPLPPNHPIKRKDSCNPYFHSNM